MAAMGAGAVIGGLMVAHRSRPSIAMLSIIGLAFGVMLLVVAAAPTEVVALVALVFMGLCSISFIATANATIQITGRPGHARSGRWRSTPSPSSAAPPSAPRWWAGSPTSPTRGSPSRSAAWPHWPPVYPSPFATGRRNAVQSSNVFRLEQGDVEPGEVVDFAPGPIIEPRPQVRAPLRHAGSA